MKNKPYDLYRLPLISDIRDMLIKKNKQMPENVAFMYPKGKNQLSKTYRELLHDVCSLGTWLYNKNIRKKHIAVIGENSYEWLVCFFAIVCGENIVVPIDKDLPDKEIKRLLLNADVEVIFYSELYSETVQSVVNMMNNNITAYSIMFIEEFIDKGSSLLESGINSYMNYKLDCKQVCCIMFTSGTAGRSKGVMLSHENIAEDINAGCQMFALMGNTLVVLPFHHAFGLVVGVFVPFNYGYSIYINKSPKRFPKDMINVKPQAVAFVPLFVESLYKQIWLNAKKEKKDRKLKAFMKLSNILLKYKIDVRNIFFKSIKQVFGGKLEYIVCGGAPLGNQYIESFRSWGIEILNGYGTTECSPCIAVNRNLYHKDGTVGLVYPNIEVKVTDKSEILVKGPIIMQGYYKDLKSTKEVLEDGWYHTGDLGYLDKEGFLTLTGRCKNLIILSNGENVSPEELETDFLKYEEVQEVLVYEKDGIIIAEIYPDKEYLNDKNEDETVQEHFDKIRKEVNKSRPLYKQVSRVCLRDTEFEKNTSRKILRYNRKDDLNARKSN